MPDQNRQPHPKATGKHPGQGQATAPESDRTTSRAMTGNRSRRQQENIPDDSKRHPGQQKPAPEAASRLPQNSRPAPPEQQADTPGAAGGHPRSGGRKAHPYNGRQTRAGRRETPPNQRRRNRPGPVRLRPESPPQTKKSGFPRKREPASYIAVCAVTWKARQSPFWHPRQRGLRSLS